MCALFTVHDSQNDSNLVLAFSRLCVQNHMIAENGADRKSSKVGQIVVFRYADDFLILTSSRLLLVFVS
jgi:hypothetical protein